MINSSDEYKVAVIADVRRMLMRAIVDISDPDIQISAATSSGEAPMSNTVQLRDKVFNQDQRYATLELNRWLLDGSQELIQDPVQDLGEVGFVSSKLSDQDCSDDSWVQLNFSNVGILQAFSVFFTDGEENGVPEDFTVQVLQGGTAYFTENVSGNSSLKASFSGFTVYNPDAIKVIVNKSGLPYRRMRTIEIIPGVYETWDNSMIAQFSVTQQGDMSGLTIPYSICSLSMDNLDRRFEPRRKSGIFQSIEERQAIDISLGFKTETGQEYKRLGLFYQYSGGWKLGENKLSIQWNLVDIVGLLSNREYIPPTALPTTLDGWIQSIVSQLGSNFADKYYVEPEYRSISLTCSVSDITGMKCGDVLRYACMASGTWARASAETGDLTVQPLWDVGNEYTLDNLVDYPTMKANNDVSAIIFTLNDGSDTQYVVSGTSVGGETKSVSNPFIHNTSQALEAAHLILSMFGGNRIALTGRGDPSSEIGDADTIQLDESTAVTARRVYQTFNITDGVLKDCQSELIQATGYFQFRNRELIEASGTWTAPAGVSQLFVVIGNGGYGGTPGTNGSWSQKGEDGIPGYGGKIWYGLIPINERQSFQVQIGAGGAVGTAGGTTTFGQYSGDNGEIFSPAYVDIVGGEAYGRTGVQVPLNNTSDGGAAGKGGTKGVSHMETWTDEEGVEHREEIIDSYPKPGTSGVQGASGFVLVYWGDLS